MNTLPYMLHSLCLAAMVVSGLVGQDISYAGPAGTDAVAAPVPADTVIHNARIFTAGKKTWAKAVAVRNGSIVYIGGNGAALKYVGTTTHVIDAQRRLVTPGFIDAHTHVAWLGMLSSAMTLVYDATNFHGLTNQIIAFADSNPSLPFVFAIGWKYDYIPGQIPTLAMADAIMTNRPLILWSHDGHTGWVNSNALAHMQAANPTAFEYLTPDYDGAHKPTGIFRHFYTINPFDFFSLGGDATLSNMANGLKATLRQALAVGVTTHHDVMIHRTVFDLLEEMERRGAFADARVRGSYFINHHMYYGNYAGLMNDLDDWQACASNSTEHLVMGESVKLGIDGVAPNHTSFLSQPYADDTTTVGVASYAAADFAQLATHIDARRVQMCTHGTGDAGIRRIIDGYEQAHATNSPWDARHTIEHNSAVTDADIKRMVELGIHASMQPTHYYGDQAIVLTLGEDRFRRMHRIGTLGKAKVPLAFGTDYSIVPFNPLYGIVAAVTRINCLGLPATRDEKKERISVKAALKHYTIGSARTLHMNDIVGSIEPGKRADLVVFSMTLDDLGQAIADILEGGSTQVLDNLVDMTLVDGRVVYQKDVR